jgi:hypothetical protein
MYMLILSRLNTYEQREKMFDITSRIGGLISTTSGKLNTTVYSLGRFINSTLKIHNNNHEKI